jgi:hypothetical protein
VKLKLEGLRSEGQWRPGNLGPFFRVLRLNLDHEDVVVHDFFQSQGVLQPSVLVCFELRNQELLTELKRGLAELVNAD